MIPMPIEVLPLAVIGCHWWYQWHTNAVRSFAIGSHWLPLVPIVVQWLPFVANGFYHW